MTARWNPHGPSRPVALVLAGLAALATLAPLSFASAQVSESGENFPEPVVTGTTNVYSIGHIGTGTFSVEGGSQFSAGALFVGALGTGNGTVTIDGSGTTVTLTPPNGDQPISVGQYGTGLMTISGGAVVNCAAGCTSSVLATVVAQAAGSNGTLNITGTGSTLNAANSFIVGHDQVSEAPDLSGTFGTPGASATGTVNITAGGTLNTGNATIAQNANVNYVPPQGATNNPTGTETSTGIVNVSGSGATWNITSPTNGVVSPSGLTVGVGTNTTGSVSVTNSGAVNLGTTNSSFQVEIDLGGAGSTSGGNGSVTVNGGSINFTSGTDDVIQVGRLQGNGTMTIEGGGTVSGALQTLVGRDGSTGSLTVNGAGSSLTLSGTNATNGAYLGIGTADTIALGTTYGATSNGTVLVENGGTITVNTNNNQNGGMNIGENGGTGRLTITGIGSQFSISGNNSNTNTGGGATIGRSGNGTLNVLAGGQFTVNNTGTTAGSGITIGGSPGQVTNGEQAGTGTVTVSGAGSQFNLLSTFGTITAGYSGTGTLNVQNGGTVVSEDLAIGRNTGSTGLVSIDGSGSSVTLSGNDVNNGAGARVNVGESGTGSLSLTNQAQLLINPTNPNGGVIIGGASGLPSGVGTMTVSGGSQVLISGQNNLLNVGRNGTGTLTITGASTVDVAHGLGSTGQTFVGASAPGIAAPTVALAGSVTVANGSTLNAGSLLGIGSDGVNNNTGTGSVLLSGNSTVNATNVVVGQNGVLGGNGTVNGNVTVNGGTVSPGASPDPLNVNGNYSQTGGTIEFEVDPNGSGGFLESTLVFNPSNTVSIDDAHIVFDFLNGADPLAFFNTGQFTIDEFFKLSNSDLFSTDFNVDNVFQGDTFGVIASDFVVTNFNFIPDQGATVLAETAVPEPGSLELLATALIGLVGVGYARRRRWLGRQTGFPHSSCT